MTDKQRIHNEWFTKLSTPTWCECKLSKKGQVYSWSEYVHGKKRNILQFCSTCFKDRVARLLDKHAKDCGCLFRFQYISFYSKEPDFFEVMERKINDATTKRCEADRKRKAKAGRKRRVEFNS